MRTSKSLSSTKPLVSVIIVNYNAGKLLKKAVDSVINFPEVEVVVADNASKDDSFISLTNLPKRPNLILIDNGANLGFGKAVNQAVKKSHGEYIYLLNPDASLTSTALNRMIETSKKYQNRAIVAPRLENPDSTPQSSCYRPQTIINAIKEYWFGVKGAYTKYLPKGKAPQKVNAAVAAAWLVTRSVWEELHGLSDRFFLYFEDLDMCDRAHQANIDVIYDPQAIVKHSHGVSSRTNPIVMKLFYESALTYHGRVKKLLIDLIIHLRDFFLPPISSKKILGIILLYTLFVFGITSIGYFILPSRLSPSSLIPTTYHSNFLLWSWANFDGAHYLNIAINGYQNILGQSEYAFFPLFPLLISLLSKTGISHYLSAHLLVLLSAVGFVVVLLKWATKYLKNPLTILWLVLLSPGAIFLSAIYTEPLFLFLTVSAFYFSDRKQWGSAAIMTALATATRVNGLFLVLFLLLKLLNNKTLKILTTYYLLLATFGFFAYSVYLYSQTGDALAFFHAQAGWQKSSIRAPWVMISNYFRALTLDFIPDLTHFVVIIEVLVTSLLIYLLITFWRNRKFNSAYKYYALGNLLLPLATGSLGSMPRFSLTLFPLFLVIPSLPKRLRIVTISLFIIFCTTGIILFTRGYWFA